MVVRLAAIVALTMMALHPLTAAAAGRQSAAEGQSPYALKILSAPGSGDELAFRTALHGRADAMTGQMFNALAKVLGGTAPTVNFVPDVGTGGEFHASATPARNAVNFDPAVVEGLIDENSVNHSGAVNVVPHELAHLRQTPSVYASIPDREGGAQAFADQVSPLAAAAANTYYNRNLNYDGVYAPYVAQALQRGPSWIMGAQFGHAPVSLP